MKKMYLMPIVFMIAIQCFYSGAMRSESMSSMPYFQTCHLPEVGPLLIQTNKLSKEILLYRDKAMPLANKELLLQLSTSETERITELASEDSGHLEDKITCISKVLLGKYLDVISRDIPYNSEIVAALLHAQTEQRVGIPSVEVWFITHDFQDKLNAIITGKSKEIETREKTRIEQLKTELRAEIRGEIEKFAEYICTAFKKVDQNFGKFQFRACSYGGHPLGVSLVTACSFEPIPIIKIAGQKALALVTPE